jgi:hypothetical protein
LVVGLVSLCCSACGGGGGGGTAAAGQVLPASATAAPTNAATAVPSSTAGAAAGSIGPGGLAIDGYGGLKGSTYTAHSPGSSYDYAEVVTVDFPTAIDLTSFNANFSISPSAPFQATTTNSGKRVLITMRYTPGTLYTFSFAAGLAASNGTTLPATQTFTLSTPANVVIPAPSRAISGEPYRYGFLVHPYGDSLAGSTETEVADILASTNAGFVRIDYGGAVVMPTSGTYDFAPYDAIVALLATHNITELPILEQYNTAAWQAGGQAYPAIWSSPQLYAQFVGAVVGHLRTTAPQITRVELFNEPNLSGWWTSPNPAYAATDGSATAAYMLAGYAAAKAANPAITVVGPALASGGNVVDPRTFLTNMYAAGCRTGTCWDVLSVHNYSWMDPTYALPSSQSNRWQVYQDLQAIAVAHGDPMPHVMLTEWGFSTAALPNGFDPHVQARYMAIGFNLMLADPTIDGIVWTNVYASGSDFWSRVSVTDASFAPLPSESTFRTFATP